MPDRRGPGSTFHASLPPFPGYCLGCALRPVAEAVLAAFGEDSNQFVPLYPDAWRPDNAAYEAVRPAPADVAGLPPAEPHLNYGLSTFWDDPTACTEGALTRAAVEGGEAAAQWERKLREPRPRNLSLW